MNAVTLAVQSPANRRVKFDDDEIVDGLRAGTVSAIEQIMAVYRPQIYAQAFRFTRNHHEAEEIVQETFLRAWQAAPRFRADSSLATWLHAIATNVARNRYWYWRRRKRHKTVSLNQPLSAETDATLGDALVVTERTPVEESEQNDLTVQIVKGMERLSHRDRGILLLRNARQVPYAEMAGVLGITIGTVKSRLARARERLRALVQAEIGHETPFLRKTS